MALDISEPVYSAFTAVRLVREFGKKPSQSRISAQTLVRSLRDCTWTVLTSSQALPQNLQRISASIETLDGGSMNGHHGHTCLQFSTRRLGQRNEYAHMQYCAQIKAPPDHHLARTQTSLSTLIGTSLRHFEASLLLFLSIWARLRSDCRSLAQWINTPDVEVRVICGSP
jgi:hypothetical protein